MSTGIPAFDLHVLGKEKITRGTQNFPRIVAHGKTEVSKAFIRYLLFVQRLMLVCIREKRDRNREEEDE